LFFNNLSLPILYSILFFHIRRQLRNFLSVTSTNDHTTNNDLEPWQDNLEHGTPLNPTSPSNIQNTQTKSITSEERSKNMLQTRVNETAERTRRRMNQVAVTLLCYPIAYFFLTAPILVIPIASFLRKNIPVSVVYVLSSIYSSSGWVNVLLYTITRKGIISWNWLLRWPKCRNQRQVPSLRFHQPPFFTSRHSIPSTKVPVADNLDSKVLLSSLSQEKLYAESDSSYGRGTYVTQIQVPEPVRLVHSPSCLFYHASVDLIPDATTIRRRCNCSISLA
jgi:hypothetical protein